VTVTRTGATLTTTLALAAAAWVVAVRQMSGMDMGAATELGSFWFFAAVWVPMMAAMMLPGAVPVLLGHARLPAGARFVGSYLGVWTLVGLAVYLVYRPHGAAATGALTIAAGLYELSPLKRYCRRRCRETLRSGLGFGIYCVGSSIGLMAMLAALGLMSVTWMCVVAFVVSLQKLLPLRASIDIPLALSIVGLGILILA
jgi:predicted metal-binding membrane protein